MKNCQELLAWFCCLAIPQLAYSLPSNCPFLTGRLLAEENEEIYPGPPSDQGKMREASTSASSPASLGFTPHLGCSCAQFCMS